MYNYSMYNETTDVAKVNKEGNSWDLVQTGFEDFFFFFVLVIHVAGGCLKLLRHNCEFRTRNMSLLHKISNPTNNPKQHQMQGQIIVWGNQCSLFYIMTHYN